MSDGIFDEAVAARYDQSAADMFDPGVIGPTVDFLAELAGGGRALEFAVGTGRVALPLSERGVEVAGLELSRAMVDRLRAKPGADCLGCGGCHSARPSFRSTSVPTTSASTSSTWRSSDWSRTTTGSATAKGGPSGRITGMSGPPSST